MVTEIEHSVTIFSYEFASSGRSLLQHAAQQNPTWTFAELRRTYGNDGGLAILSKII